MEAAKPAELPGPRADKRTEPSETLLYSAKEGTTVLCETCGHMCVIQEGKTGICGTRLNKGGKLMSLTYGLSTGLRIDPIEKTILSIDPIEKKPLYHTLSGSGIVSIGGVGCNFKCKFCQNYQSSQAIQSIISSIKAKKKPEVCLEQDIEEMGLEYNTPKQIVEYTLRSKTNAIAFTYNEPTIHLEYYYDTMKLAAQHGMFLVFKSNGFQSPATIAQLAPYLHAINIDLKSFSPKFYRQVCGGELDVVCESIKLWHRYGVWVEVTTLVIEGHNDSDEELTKIAQFIASVDTSIPWHLSAAHPMYLMTDFDRTSYSTLVRAMEIGKKAGLKFIYPGNVAESEYQHTYCPKCRKVLVQRGRYGGYGGRYTSDFDPQAGECKQCHEKIPGIWSWPQKK